METILTVAQMRQSDAAAIAREGTGRELMARAGAGVFAAGDWPGRTAIVCGTGNNAGDGYVLAGLLWAAGKDCRLFLLEETFSADGRYFFDRAIAAGVPWELFTPQTSLVGYDTVADCLFGTGFHGPARGLAALAIRAINQSGAFVVAVDIGSGLNGDNGRGSPVVQADMTVSIGSPQPGHYLNDAKDVQGRLVNVDIGIPPVAETIFLPERRDYRALFAPRKHNAHKGSYGYVGILGGCLAYSGAVKLANLSQAALRCGCGVATLLVPACVARGVLPYLLESTLCPLPDRDGFMVFDEAALRAGLAGKAALAVGMGWGRGPDNLRILEYILTQTEMPLILDADGLNTLAELDKARLGRGRRPVVLTPHVLEFSRLTGLSREEILADPVGTARAFAREWGVAVLLKGPTTVVTDGTVTYLVDRGCPGMATAGSGDVLSGVLVGLLGYLPFGPLTLACGAYVAGLAGELAQAEKGPVSLTAGDTAAHIGEAMRRLLTEDGEEAPRWIRGGKR